MQQSQVRCRVCVMHACEWLYMSGNHIYIYRGAIVVAQPSSVITHAGAVGFLLQHSFLCSQAVTVCSFSPSIYAQGECFLMRRNCYCNCCSMIKWRGLP
jgi:hypothetical protein